MTFTPANLQWVGVARESVYGTAIASPTLFIPSDSPTYHLTTQILVDKNLRGSMGAEFEQLQGVKFGTVSFKTNAYIDSVFFLLRALLGYPDQVTGSSDPYTHTTALQNTGNNGQPVSTTVFWTDGGRTQQMAGAQAQTVKVTIKPDGFVQLEVTFIGLPATQIAIPTNTPTTAKPWPAWNTTITLGGTASTNYSELSIDYKRATEAIITATGTQSPYAIYAGEVSVSGSFTGVYQGYSTDKDWLAYLANTQPAFIYSVAPAGDVTHSLTVTHSKVAYDDVQVSGTNKWMEVKATIKALSNTTDAIGGLFSPAQVVLTSPASTAI